MSVLTCPPAAKTPYTRRALARPERTAEIGKIGSWVPGRTVSTATSPVAAVSWLRPPDLYPPGSIRLSGDRVSMARRLISPMASIPICDSSRVSVVARAAMTRGHEGR